MMDEKKKLILPTCILLAVLIGGLAIKGNRDMSGDNASQTPAEIVNPVHDGPEDQKNLPGNSLPDYPGTPLSEPQVRSVIEEFVRVRLPDVALEHLASGVEPEQLGTRGLISFSVAPSEIVPILDEIRKIWKAATADGKHTFNFSESIGLTGHDDIELDEMTHRFIITSPRQTLKLPDRMNEELGFDPNRQTKDYQIFLYLCPTNGNVRMMWQNYPH